ncbi:hypothetical protein [Eisenbergiella sp.]
MVTICAAQAAAREEKADALLIAGGVYDRAVPEEERLLDELLIQMLAEGSPVPVIAEKHDSPERLGSGHHLWQAEEGKALCSLW